MINTNDEKSIKLQRYNPQENLVYYEYINGFKEWVRFDDPDKFSFGRNKEGVVGFTCLPTYYRNSLGIEWTASYDSKGRVVDFKENSGTEYHRKFDDNDNMVSYKSNSPGVDMLVKYDNLGNILSYRRPDGVDEYYSYDYETGAIISYVNSNGRISMYDKFNKCWHDKYPLCELTKEANVYNVPVKGDKPLETWRYFNDNGEEVEYKDNYGYHLVTKSTGNGSQITKRELYIDGRLEYSF